MASPITPKRMASTVVETLKWLVVPRQAWAATMATYSTKTTAVVQPISSRVRRHDGSIVNTHARVGVYIADDAANLAGFSHAGAPPIVRGSTKMPTKKAARAASISRPTAVSGL